MPELLIPKQGVAEGFLADARSHPEQNTKHQSGWAELGAWANKNKVWLKPHEWAISMTYMPKLGINPGPGISEDTPRGIYFYPFHWAYSVKKDKEALPWADNAPYIQLFQYSTVGGLHDPNQIPLANAVAELKNYGITDEDIAAEKENHPSISTYGLLVWCLGRKYDDSKRVTILNKVLRNLGYNYILDNGKGWIAINEPTQGVVLNPTIINKVVTFNNYTRKKEQGMAEGTELPGDFKLMGQNLFLKNLARNLQQRYPAATVKLSSDRVTAHHNEGDDEHLTVMGTEVMDSGYIGVGLDDAFTESFQGVLVPTIKQTTEQLLAANPGMQPALFLSTDNWNPDAWTHIADKLGYRLVADDESLDEGLLGNMLPWPEVVNKINSAMRAMGWKGQRKDDGSFVFTTRGAMTDEYYIVIIDNEGDSMFTYALGTVEEGDPHIGEQDTLPTTEASVSELMNAVRDGFGLNENFADGKNPGRKGLAKRSGVNTKASVSSLRKTAKNSSGEKQRMAHWLANMKAGRAKARKK